MNGPVYSVELRWGGSEDQPAPARLREIIAELETRDEEHPDTWLTHEASEWVLRLDEDGYAYLDDGGAGTVAHMANVSADRALDLWLRFAHGGREAVDNEPWQEGPRHRGADEIEARRRRAEAQALGADRDFYTRLGAEFKDAACRSPGCARGHIKHSVLCRSHHFEQVMRRDCPFHD